MGLFGSKKLAEQLEAENADLRAWVTHLQGQDALQLAEEKRRLESEVTRLRHLQEEAAEALQQARAHIVQTEDIAMLQEAGIYEFRHRLDDATAYKAQLAQLKNQIKAMTRQGNAVTGATTWHVNGSAAEGRKMVRDFSKLMLRAYNAEADAQIRTMRPYRLRSATERLEKSVTAIARLGKTMDIRITPAYHRLRLQELALTADYLAKVEEEKERVREERERAKEEASARREFEQEKARLLRERSHYESALKRLEQNGDAEGIADLQAKLQEVDSAITDVEGREANIRAGYVYVISNLGAFGERIVKIGLTRRLDPTERVRELGDASVPFRFDIHALVFSEDAVSLETQLHQQLWDRRVNRVNQRREFFYATPAEIRDVLENIAGPLLLEFTETPEASEWRQSQPAPDDEEQGHPRPFVGGTP